MILDWIVLGSRVWNEGRSWRQHAAGGWFPSLSKWGGACHATDGASLVAFPTLPCVPPPLPRRNRSVLPSLASRAVAAFRVRQPGRLPHHTFRGLLGVQSRCGPHGCRATRGGPSSECFNRGRYLPQPLRVLPAGATVAGRDSHPLGRGALHGALSQRR